MSESGQRLHCAAFFNKKIYYTFHLLFRNRLISAGIEPELVHTEKSYIRDSFPRLIK